MHSANIINNDLSKILFSDYAKVAAVRPIFKKYDRTDIKEYRPVSLLNCFSKVYEKFLNKQLLHFLNHSLYIVPIISRILIKNSQDIKILVW